MCVFVKLQQQHTETHRETIHSFVHRQKRRALMLLIHVCYAHDSNTLNCRSFPIWALLLLLHVVWIQSCVLCVRLFWFCRWFCLDVC